MFKWNLIHSRGRGTVFMRVLLEQIGSLAFAIMKTVCPWFYKLASSSSMTWLNCRISGVVFSLESTATASWYARSVFDFGIFNQASSLSIRDHQGGRESPRSLWICDTSLPPQSHRLKQIGRRSVAVHYLTWINRIWPQNEMLQFESVKSSP